MEIGYKTIWDYKGWLSHTMGLYLQADWNQTLITKINQISAQIFKSSPQGGANTLIMHPKLSTIIEDCPYYNAEVNILCGKYWITFNNMLPKDKIYVYRKDFPVGPIIIDDDGYTIIHSLSPNIEKYRNKDNVHIITPEMLIGEITILNYD